MDNNGISTSDKGKALISSNGIKAYSKEALREEICRLIITNVQLANDKLDIEAAKIKLEADKATLINEKNIFVAKREELRIELTAIVPTTNTQVFVIIVCDKLKAKRLPPFDKIKETLQRFFTRTRYYYGFYNQSLLFDLDKV